MKRFLGMISCEEALERLWEFLDGELSARDQVAVKRHLDICDRCFPEYDFRRAYLEFTRRVRALDRAPPGLRRRLFRQILEREAGGGTTS